MGEYISLSDLLLSQLETRESSVLIVMIGSVKREMLKVTFGVACKRARKVFGELVESVSHLLQLSESKMRRGLRGGSIVR